MADVDVDAGPAVPAMLDLPAQPSPTLAVVARPQLALGVPPWRSDRPRTQGSGGQSMLAPGPQLVRAGLVVGLGSWRLGQPPWAPRPSHCSRAAEGGVRCPAEVGDTILPLPHPHGTLWG